MTPKAGFAERFPGYAGWLRAQIEHVAAAQTADAAEGANAADGGSVLAGATAAKLEARLGEMLEARVSAGCELGRESFAKDVLLLRRRAASADSNGGEADDER